MSLKVLPVVKAYPVIDPVSQTEAVCVAVISMETPYRWIRLFPLDYRGLVYAQRFKKYEAIELKASKSTKDSRPESFTPILDSIITGEFIGTDNGTWRRRLPFFDAVEDQSMCEIQRRQKTERKSLGVFRPLEVTDLKVTAARGLRRRSALYSTKPRYSGIALATIPVRPSNRCPSRRSSRTAAQTRHVRATNNRSSTGSWERCTGALAGRATTRQRSMRRFARSSSSSTAATTTTRASSPGAC
jgi:hypothetical protein